MVERRNAVVGVSVIALIILLVFFVLPAMGIELFPFGKARAVVNVYTACLGIPLNPLDCWFDEPSTTVSINKFVIASIFPPITLSTIEREQIKQGTYPAAIFPSCGWLGGGLYTTAKFYVTEIGFYEEKSIHVCGGDNIVNFYFPLSNQIECYNWKLVVSDVTKTGRWCSG